MNRPVRSRTQGGVGRAEEMSALTRLPFHRPLNSTTVKAHARKIENQFSRYCGPYYLIQLGNNRWVTFAGYAAKKHHEMSP